MNSKQIREKTKSWEEILHRQLTDRDEAAGYLGYCFKQGAESFLLALNDVVAASGGVGKVAKASGLSRESLYKLLSGERGARLSTVITLLETLGIDTHFEFGSSRRKVKRKLVGEKAA